MGMVKILGFPSWNIEHPMTIPWKIISPLPRHWSHWCWSYPHLRRCCCCDRRPACVSPGSAVSPWDMGSTAGLHFVESNIGEAVETFKVYHGFIHERMGHLWFIRQTTRKNGGNLDFAMKHWNTCGFRNEQWWYDVKTNKIVERNRWKETCVFFPIRTTFCKPSLGKKELPPRIETTGKGITYDICLSSRLTLNQRLQKMSWRMMNWWSKWPCSRDWGT